MISLGSFCIAKTMIERAGFSQPTYPFDDLFASVGCVTHAIDDGLKTFLDYDNLLPGPNDQSWVQRLYRQMLGEQMTFAHHDMRLPQNRAKFERRRDRLLALTKDNNPLFVLISYADRMGGVRQLEQLRDAISRRYGASHLLICTFGKSGVDDVIDFTAPNTTLRCLIDDCPISGKDFVQHEHADFMVAAIRDAYERSGGLRDGRLSPGAGKRGVSVSRWILDKFKRTVSGELRSETNKGVRLL
ncbi:hypothetical protein HL653_07270 [Sphingomonas sp. AP4-R1]|uniref:DUF1796 family putative cysteine peptidase n=1 Tax=Sphingomonas sp. AP4-R1 TaxID=2735134 RepID=UPI001493C671|nr:DUF1796 family putative cysteine peptidase [Sphingomonas sp. AP4-R1]QJU57617.1 hypothetical protein HL653_07270 [Sphingomonas sp. AP4-R1]